MSKPEKVEKATERKLWTGRAATIEKATGLYVPVFLEVVDGIVTKIDRGPGDTLRSVQTRVDLYVRKNAQQ